MPPTGVLGVPSSVAGIPCFGSSTNAPGGNVTASLALPGAAGGADGEEADARNGLLGAASASCCCPLPAIGASTSGKRDGVSPVEPLSSASWLMPSVQGRAWSGLGGGPIFGKLMGGSSCAGAGALAPLGGGYLGGGGSAVFPVAVPGSAGRAGIPGKPVPGGGGGGSASCALLPPGAWGGSGGNGNGDGSPSSDVPPGLCVTPPGGAGGKDR
mmetsp:Transcript_89767/g.169098  ORF Transcript_89767/g.169098 Transcript_89767/m.169098 type:complete len:213 (-) Transcript_89767:5874-6512(-)